MPWDDAEIGPLSRSPTPTIEGGIEWRAMTWTNSFHVVPHRPPMDPKSTTGYQIVFLDEHGAELQRGPDIYGRDVKWIAEGECGYTFVRQADEGGQTVRYFQRGRLDD